MKRVVFRPRAKLDIREIRAFSVRMWGYERSAAYIAVIESALRNLASGTFAGRPIDHIRSGYFRQNVSSHVIFYRQSNDEIEVVRVLHARMNFDRHL